MDAKLAPVDQAFEQEVAVLFDDLVTSAGGISRSAWRDAVLARGWTVPKWPSEHGGMEWRATQHFLWDKACAAYVHDDPFATGRETVGPLLLGLSAVDENTLREFVDGIRTYRQTWCVAVAEPDVHLALAEMTSVVRDDDAGRRLLDGSKCWVEDALTADLCCCLYRVDVADDLFELGVIELRSTGVTRREQGLVFAAAPIKAILWQGSLEQANLLAQPLLSRDLGGAAQLGLVEAQIQALRSGLLKLSEAEDLRARLAMLEVDLAGLQALQLRYLDALEKSITLPFPQAVLHVRTRELAVKVGELLVESFGYYALPYPDPLLSHNEGALSPPGAVFTPDQGVLSVSRLLTATARAGYMDYMGMGYKNSVFALKDSLGEHLLVPRA